MVKVVNDREVTAKKKKKGSDDREAVVKKRRNKVVRTKETIHNMK